MLDPRHRKWVDHWNCSVPEPWALVVLVGATGIGIGIGIGRYCLPVCGDAVFGLCFIGFVVLLHCSSGSSEAAGCGRQGMEEMPARARTRTRAPTCPQSRVSVKAHPTDATRSLLSGYLHLS